MRAQIADLKSDAGDALNLREEVESLREERDAFRASSSAGREDEDALHQLGERVRGVMIRAFRSSKRPLVCHDDRLELVSLR